MKPKIVNVNGINEIIIDDNCNTDKFYSFAEFLSKHMDINFSEIVEDLDSIYWDFEFKGSYLVLHYNIYTGITICPKNPNKATQEDNRSLSEISDQIIHILTGHGNPRR